MNIFHLKSKAGPDGKVHIGDLDIGTPDVEVDIAVSYPGERLPQEQWARRFDELASRIDASCFERLPQPLVGSDFEET